MAPEKSTILVIEDDMDISASVVELLTDEGYRAVAAGNGAEGLKLLKEGLRPQMILLDLMMPVMDGFTFIAELAKISELASIPVVIMSADGNVLDKKGKTHAAAYLKKPLDISDLIQLCARHAQKNQ